MENQIIELRTDINRLERLILDRCHFLENSLRDEIDGLRLRISELQNKTDKDERFLCS